MRIPREEQLLAAIKKYTPKWRFRACARCKAAVKNEPMWKRRGFYPMCTTCAPTRLDAYELIFDHPFHAAK